jgi:hypothetical protein
MVFGTRTDSGPGLILVLFCLLTVASWPSLCSADGALSAGASSAGDDLTLRIDPAFTPSRLGPTERAWYDRLLASMSNSRTLIDTRAGEDDLYTLGRSVGDYTASLLLALRATGDRAFLDRVAEISEIYRADLADAWDNGTQDGFVNWRWHEDPASSYYGTDLHQLDETMTHGNVALVAYAFHVNRDVDPSYGEKADFWRGYLENQFLAKWTARAGGDPVAAWDNEGTGLYKRYTHPRANQLRLAYYLWKITGNDFYRQRAEPIATELLAHVQTNPDVPSAYRWKHQVSGSDLGWQQINYAHYFMFPVLEMHLENYLGYASESNMGRYASTFRDVVFGPFGPGYGTMAYRVYGTETAGSEFYEMAGFGRWDQTGSLLNMANSRYLCGLDGVYISAGALMAVSQRHGTTTGVEPGTGGPPARHLAPPAPNPFRSQTDIRIHAAESPVNLAVYDVSGRLVRRLTAARHATGPLTGTWDGTDAAGAEVASGIYYIRLARSGPEETRSVVRLR